MSRRRHRSILITSLILTFGLVAAGCGDKKTQDDDAGLKSGGDNGSAEVRGVTDTEITIAGLGPLTSQQGGYPGVDTGAKARFERANREGGIAGRKIKFIGFEDDGEDPSKNLDLARQLVQQDNVFAVSPAVGQSWLPPTTDFLQQNEVPFVGWGVMPGFCGNSFGFGFDGCSVNPDPKVANTGMTQGIVELEGLGEGSTVAVQSFDNEAGRASKIQVEATLKAAGIDVVYSDAKIPTTDVADFTPFVQKIMTSADGDAPDAVLMMTQFTNSIGLTGALKAAGYEGATMNYVTYTPELLDSKQVADSLDGTYVLAKLLPQEFGGTAIEQMKEDLKAIGEDEEIGTFTSVGYWSADVTIQMLEKVGRDLTPETFDEVINGGFIYEPQGEPFGIGPVEFPRDHDQAMPCGAILQVEGTEYVPVVPLTCYENIPLD